MTKNVGISTNKTARISESEIITFVSCFRSSMLGKFLSLCLLFGVIIMLLMVRSPQTSKMELLEPMHKWLVNAGNSMGTIDKGQSKDRKVVQLKNTHKHNTHVVIIADMAFQLKYRLQIESVRCYTDANNYNLILPSEREMDIQICKSPKIPNMYLRRHCILANIMEQFVDDDVFILLDADTIAFDLKRQLPLDIYRKHDIVYYERSWNGEVQCHMWLKNKPVVREWIRLWSLEDSQPYVPAKQYFYGTENGLLHILLMKWFILGVKSVESMQEITDFHWPEPKQRIAANCIEIFNKLNQTVNNLEPYWSYVMCARVALGMQGKGEKFDTYGQGPSDDYILQDFRKHGVEMSAQGLSLKILPRYQGLALDHFLKSNAQKGVILLHGVKEEKDVPKYWKTEKKNVTAGHDTHERLSIYPLCKATYNIPTQG